MAETQIMTENERLEALAETYRESRERFHEERDFERKLRYAVQSLNTTLEVRITRLEAGLREIASQDKVEVSRCIDADPAGNTYEITETDGKFASIANATLAVSIDSVADTSKANESRQPETVPADVHAIAERMALQHQSDQGTIYAVGVLAILADRKANRTEASN